MDSTSTQYPQNSLLGLPAELRSIIFRLLWRSRTVEVQRGQARQDESSTSPVSLSCDISRQPGIPDDVVALRRTYKLFSIEVDNSWHSEVTYHFPTTVSFIDVLSQWPEEKFRSLSYVHVVDTPLPLQAFVDPGFFVTHNFSQALPMFPGLQLELLTVENIWLHANGDPTSGVGCYAATNGTIRRLLLTSGWKRLRYLSGILPLTPTQMMQLDQLVEHYRVDQAEPEFHYGLGRVQPTIMSGQNLLDPSEGYEDLETTERLVSQWYAELEDEEQPHDVRELPKGVPEKHLAMWVERGPNSNYIQDGSELSSTLESLQNNITWMNLRKTDVYLVGDGVHDLSAYL